MKFKYFSVKSKTIIFVLSIISMLSILFFLIRYYDIKAFAEKSQENELKKVKLVYTKTLQQTKKFYITRGYANINSYKIRESFILNDIKMLKKLSQPRWNVISKENRFLESFSFYSKEKELLTFFGKPPLNRLKYDFKNSYDGFWFDIDSFYYHAVSIAKDTKGNIVGYIVFTINPKYFLYDIRKLIDIDAYIQYKNIIFSLDDTKNITTYDKNHLKYIVKGDGIDKQNDFKIIFLQDISYWKSIVKKAFIQGVVIFLLISLITYIVLNYGFELILKKLDQTNKKLRKSQKELKELNQNLQIKVDQEIELRLSKQQEAEEKKRMLIHQNKLASMGEMIGNIAHQWRQPLTELSLVFISMQLYFERNKLTKERFEEKVKEANQQISYMSNSIDDFRNFFSSGQEKINYSIQDVIQTVNQLLGATLKNNNIKLDMIINNNFELMGYPNELAQAILNIISNAKDMILENKIKNGLITIKSFKKDKNYSISIKDNAGGIKVFPIEKIFEPYFSTRHSKSGTGIGLYMTKMIIEKNNNGDIFVENLDDGAIFYITFTDEKSSVKI